MQPSAKGLSASVRCMVQQFAKGWNVQDMKPMQIEAALMSLLGEHEQALKDAARKTVQQDTHQTLAMLSSMPMLSTMTRGTLSYTRVPGGVIYWKSAIVSGEDYHNCEEVGALVVPPPSGVFVSIEAMNKEEV